MTEVVLCTAWPRECVPNACTHRARAWSLEGYSTQKRKQLLDSPGGGLTLLAASDTSVI